MKIYLLLLLLLLNLTIRAQHQSQTDSVVYYLKQIKGLQKNDTTLIEKVAATIYNISPDSLLPDKIDIELQRLSPIIHKQNYLALKTVIFEVLSLSKTNIKTLDYGKNLISELLNYSNRFEKNLLLTTLAQLRFPFRNTSKINEGLNYYYKLSNYFEQANDSDATSICYYVLGGINRALGLTDKTIYCQLKSINYLNPKVIIQGNDFLIPKYDSQGLIGLINRKAVLGCMLIDYDNPKNAFQYIYEAKAIYESIRDSVEVSDGPFIYLQIIRAKMMTKGDSINYYFDLMNKALKGKNKPDYTSNYYQAYGYYCYLQNQLDSAEYYIQKSAKIKDSNKLMINSYVGFILPGYYLALIKIKQHKYEDAIKLLNDESKELLKVNLRKITLKEWELLANTYKMNGEYENSTNTLKQYVALQKQIINDENNSRSISFETEQQINLLNIEKQKQQQEIIRQKFIRRWITVVLGLVLIFSLIILFQRNRISKERKLSEKLLLNILPYEIAKELKNKGKSDAKMFDDVTVMFTDFKGFTQISERLSPAELVNEIDICFKAFDNIIMKHNIEKIKTIGDSYMCAGGLPVINKTNATDVVSAALEIQQFMLEHLQKRNSEGKETFETRIGVHTGPVVAGIVGIRKFAYDIWGDTVNIASRMESSGEIGKVNISGSTYELVKDKYNCTYRGKIQAKNKGEIDMYFVTFKD
ncbi:MAG: adenylate/guanylate cyclase domain-containing protein [Bacteroidota bacterium]